MRAVAMAAEVNGQRVRRTQAERTAAMRTRLLDATIECLVSYGYAGTTTPRVAQLAGVTRGAQIHHFRSKEDLVVAAIEHLAQQRAQAAIRELGRVQASADPVSTMLDFLWEAHQGPMFTAALELWVAAAPIPSLARHVERVEPVVNSTLIAAIAQLVPGPSGAKEDSQHRLHGDGRAAGHPGGQFRRPRPRACAATLGPGLRASASALADVLPPDLLSSADAQRNPGQQVVQSQHAEADHRMATVMLRWG